MNDRPLRILSLGAGVQSTTVLLMSCRGELPKLDHAIFADTQWEPQTVYDHLHWLKGYAEAEGIPVHIVTKGDLRAHTVRAQIRGKGRDYASLPLRVLNQDGSDGMVRRQCTREYKIEPIEKYIKAEILGIAKGKRWPKEHVVDQWFGISSDEVQRMKQSDKPWKRHVYPLVGYPFEMLGRVVTRQGCTEWLNKHYPEIDCPRSACIGCPYHSDHEWRSMKKDHPEEFADAVEVDEAIRHADGMDGTVYLHRSCKPLKDVDFSTDIERGQIALFDEECDGMCGV